MPMINGSTSHPSWVAGKPRQHSVSCISPAGLHRMAYQEWGDPGNPDVVVCVHGLTRISDDFNWLARALESNFRVVCPDVVGRGRSSWLKNPMLYGVPQYTSDMVTLLARLNVQRVRWVGTSMGGLIGMSLAALEGSPVTHLVLNDVGAMLSGRALARIASYVGVKTEFESRDAAYAHLREIFSGFGPHTESQWRELLDSVLVPIADSARVRLHYDPAIAKPFQQAYTQEKGADTGTGPSPASGAIPSGSAPPVSVPPASAGAKSEPADLNLWSLYDAIRCPTLILRGAQSDLLTASVMNEMCHRGPRARAVEFEGMGHAPSLMHEDQIRAITDFLHTETIS